MFQSPEGDSLFFYQGVGYQENFDDWEFQSPEGDSLFFYLPEDFEQKYGQPGVSVPRRGFIVFLLGRTSDRDRAVALFQSPEGDSLFFYLPWPTSPHWTT